MMSQTHSSMAAKHLNATHLETVFAHVASDMYGDPSMKLDLKKMGTGATGAGLYRIEIPYGMVVTEDAQAEAIIYASTVPSDPPIRCIGMRPRKPPGENTDEITRRHHPPISSAMHSASMRSTSL